MAHSSKDGRRGGSHRGGRRGKEYWSARYRKKPMSDWGGVGVKKATHREERRLLIQATQREAEALPWSPWVDYPWASPLDLED